MLVLVLLLPLSSTMDEGEFDNVGGSDGNGSLDAAAAAASSRGGDGQ
jgi:hypothetical protein